MKEEILRLVEILMWLDGLSAGVWVKHQNSISELKARLWDSIDEALR